MLHKTATPAIIFWGMETTYEFLHHQLIVLCERPKSIQEKSSSLHIQSFVAAFISCSPRPTSQVPSQHLCDYGTGRDTLLSFPNSAHDLYTSNSYCLPRPFQAGFLCLKSLWYSLTTNCCTMYSLFSLNTIRKGGFYYFCWSVVTSKGSFTFSFWRLFSKWLLRVKFCYIKPVVAYSTTQATRNSCSTSLFV